MAKKLELLNKAKPMYYNNNLSSELLKKYESAIIVLTEKDRTKPMYKVFDQNFELYLTKLPDTFAKKTVSEIFNKKIVYIGVSMSHNPAIYSRVALNPTSNVLEGIILDARLLGINVDSGETSNIDDCVYATYFGGVRAAVLLNKEKIKKDIDFHKLITTYLYMLFRKVLGKQAYLNEKQQQFLHMLTIYIYYRHYLNESGSSALYKIKKQYTGNHNILKPEFYDEFNQVMKEITDFKNIKEIFKYCIKLNIAQIHNDNKTLFDMLNLLGQAGFYAVIGSLDTLAGFICVSIYPTSFYKQTAIVNEKLQRSVEELIYNKYFTHVKIKNIA